MAKIGWYLLLLAIILPHFISAWFPGDGCCVRWNRRHDCCENRFGRCCERRNRFKRLASMPVSSMSNHRDNKIFTGHGPQITGSNFKPNGGIPGKNKPIGSERRH